MRLFHTLCLGFAAYFYLAQFGFTPLDPSPFSVSIPSIPPKNITGEFGAILIGYLRFYLGLSSFLLGIPFLAIGISGLTLGKKKMARLGTKLAIASCLVATCTSIVLFLIAPVFDHSRPATAYVGSLGSNIWSELMFIVGKGGLTIICLIAFCSASILIIQGLRQPESTELKSAEGDINETLA